MMVLDCLVPVASGRLLVVCPLALTKMSGEKSSEFYAGSILECAQPLLGDCAFQIKNSEAEGMGV